MNQIFKLLMDDRETFLQEIEKMVDRKIAAHERRVGWVSGIIGLSFVLGIFHSIWLVSHVYSR